ncbi:hypothetical protein BURMUCGD2_3818 [Burkholderia multivorans CGD2]|uniref:Uncharacterized protein n=1 Tax=Burkholderia multivorans CGD2 TaxID=513052 RepID=B9BUS8_9BURK|nr:hypothetical protein BURMUCGD2_3818 [Burkholderia multivorans CGD2]
MQQRSPGTNRICAMLLQATQSAIVCSISPPYIARDRLFDS